MDKSTGISVGNKNNASCLCKRAEYYQGADLTCIKCPDGADCSNHDGIQLSELTAKQGHWRPSLDTDIFINCKEGYKDMVDKSTNIKLSKLRCCPLDKATNISTCTSNSTNQCESGYTGKVCMSCEVGYVRQGFTCLSCPGGADLPGAIKAVVGFGVCLFIIFNIIFFTTKGDDEEDGSKKDGKKGKGKGQGKGQGQDANKNSIAKRKLKKKDTHSSQDAVGRLVGDQIMIQRVAVGTSASGGGGLNKDDLQLLSDRFKVVFSWMQIFGSLCVTYEDVPWPDTFKSFSLNVGIMVNLDVMSMFGWTACGFNLPFLEKFLIHMILPVNIIVVMLLARLPSYFLKPKRRPAQKQRFLKMAITIMLIMYPGICTRIFQVLKCKSLEGFEDKILAADFTISCAGDGRPIEVVYFFMAVYVVGVPLSILIGLKCNRKHLYDKTSPKHEAINDELGTLYNQ